MMTFFLMMEAVIKDGLIWICLAGMIISVGCTWKAASDEVEKEWSQND